MMSYGQLLSGNRLRKSSVENRGRSTEALSDKARIVTSAGFRRLQSKAQVFSLEENDGVRTRLTHTLEVSFYGELLAHQITDRLIDLGRLPAEYKRAFVTTVENACLLHDIGNPPFGHLGEYAIRHWFDENKNNIGAIWKCDGLDEEVVSKFLPGFMNFDGNAQAFRIVARLQWLDDEFGLNLSCGLLASIIKYLGTRPSKAQMFGKKAGFFETDAILISSVWKMAGLKLDKGMPAQRSPLAYIMEAADDIAYCVSDIEDALEKGIVSEDDFVNYINKSMPDNFKIKETKSQRSIGLSNSSVSKKSSKNSRFIKFKTGFTTKLVNAATDIYCHHEDEIRKGNFPQALLDYDDEAKDLSEILKKFSRDYIYSSKEAINVELSGQRIIRSILDEFWPLIKMTTSDISRMYANSTKPLGGSEFAIEKRLYLLLPSKHKINYEHSVENDPKLEHIYRMHLLVDFLSGMTDSHAVKIFGMLNGSGVIGR